MNSFDALYKEYLDLTKSIYGKKQLNSWYGKFAPQSFKIENPTVPDQKVSPKFTMMQVSDMYQPKPGDTITVLSNIKTPTRNINKYDIKLSKVFNKTTDDWTMGFFNKETDAQKYDRAMKVLDDM